MKQKIIRFDELYEESNVMALGDIQVDIGKVSSLNSIRMVGLIQLVSEGKANLLAEATEIILDIVNEQNPGVTEEQLLRSGTQKQLNAFIMAIVSDTVKTYAPLTKGDNPLVKTLLKGTTTAIKK